MLETLRYIYYAVLFSLTVYSLFALKDIRQFGGTLLVLVLAVTSLVELLGLGARYKGIGNHATWIFNLYTILIIPVYLLILKDSFSAFSRKAVLYVAGGFMVLGLVNLFFIQGLQRFNHFTLMLGAALLVLFSLLYFKSRFQNPQENLLKSWRFWVATGLLMYFPGTLLYFGFLNYLSQFDHGWLMQVTLILQLMNIMLYTLFGVALSCLRPRQISSPLL
ncbi:MULTISPECIES: hypothetical protein [Rufibacter]|uniref:Uncharacterized protein n=1 Tax=Rufibacter quisquiliarum TaxID=1549639 RepID=A0A839GSE7_9BACT|nr:MULTISPECIES: hypothetical protein [Rufibacter]MBA9078425.1 hypothetical protein [Rufibacter quisquiliarum]